MSASDTEGDPPEPPRIRHLRRLVTALTLTLTLGMVTIVGLLVWRVLSPPPSPILPEAVTVPAGERLTGYAITSGWTVLITRDAEGAERLHLVAPGSGTIVQTVPIVAER